MNFILPWYNIWEKELPKGSSVSMKQGCVELLMVVVSLPVQITMQLFLKNEETVRLLKVKR